MNYKRFIKSRETRETILRFLSFVPDKLMIKIQYRIKLGRRLNLKSPKRFTEKLQWYKLYYRDPIMKQCVDKYNVRSYIQNLGLSEILNDCYGVFDKPSDINFDILPKSFVIKDTLGGGGNSVIIVKDKSKINLNDLIRQMESWTKLSIKYKHPGREWVYDNQKHRIIIEKYIEDNTLGLIDYKFFCFYGKVHYLYVIGERKLGDSAGLAIYTSDYKRLDVARIDERPLNVDIPKPKYYSKMVKIAEKISSNFPEARVDFYYVDEKIIFGEITFFDGSGYMKFDPDEFDFIMGSKFFLNKAENERNTK